MRAVGLLRYLPVTDPQAFLDVEVARPDLRPRDLLVRVRAVSVNPVDTKMRAPRDEVEASPRVLGWDAAGEVIAVGSACTRFQAGDRVYYAGDISRAGCNSEYHAVDERVVGRMPDNLDFVQAAAVPLTVLTAWEALFERMCIQWREVPGDCTILVIGGAGGVGSMAIQLARLAGLQVIATASRPESEAWCRQLGAHHVLDHSGDLAEQMRAADLPPPRYILCCNDTDHYFDVMADLIAPEGRICAIVAARQPLKVHKLIRKSATFCWEYMFTKVLFETPDIKTQQEILDEVADLIEDGRLRSSMQEVLGLMSADTLREAHARLEGGHVIGKLVLEGYP